MFSDHRDLVVVATVRQLVGETVDSRKDLRMAHDVVTFLQMMCAGFINVAAAPAAAS